MDSLLSFVVGFVVEGVLYYVGYLFLKTVTLGRFEDPNASSWVSMVGLVVVILAGVGLYCAFSE